jgi:hypothetical protein
MIPNSNRPMTPAQVARYTGRPERSVRYAAEVGHLKGHRDPSTPKHKGWRFFQIDVDEWDNRKAEAIHD